MNYNDMKTKWAKYFLESMLLTIVLFIITVNCDEGSIGALVSGIPAIIGIFFCFLCVIKFNIYNAKANNMSADEYISKKMIGTKDNKVDIPCPVCGSKNTVRITTTSRAVSIAAFGLASGKIGKQYKCNSCKHMW